MKKSVEWISGGKMKGKVKRYLIARSRRLVYLVPALIDRCCTRTLFETSLKSKKPPFFEMVQPWNKKHV